MATFTVNVRGHGRLNLPKKLREALGLKAQDELVFQLQDDGTAAVIPASVLAARGVGMFRHLKQTDSETDVFLAERRAEAEA